MVALLSAGMEEKIKALNPRHPPSYSRGLKRLAREAEGEEMEEVVRAAGNIEDSYYSAGTLAYIALLLSRRGENFEPLFSQALKKAGEVPQEWRRAEILTEIGKRMKRAESENSCLLLTPTLEIGSFKKRRKPLMAALKSCFSGGKAEEAFSLLRKSRDPARNLKLASRLALEWGIKEEAIPGYLETMGREEKAEILTYMAGKKRGGFLSRKAREAVGELPPEKRLYYLKALTRKDWASLPWAREEAERLEPHLKAEVLVLLAGLAAERGEGRELYRKAKTEVQKLEGKERKKLLNKLSLAMEKAGMKHGGGKEIPGEKGVGRRYPPPEWGRFSLGLYNTYRGSLKEAHTRAISRAATLCYAYGMKLALFGFPLESEEEVMHRVARDTRIGGGGNFLDLLHESGGLGVFPYPKRSFIPGLGELVATTSQPERGKEFTLEREGEFYLVMGLGKKGLPQSFLNMAKKHLELTGKGVPLETCTVMGVIAERVRCYSR